VVIGIAGITGIAGGTREVTPMVAGTAEIQPDLGGEGPTLSE
jgi:hypothetical protein